MRVEDDAFGTQPRTDISLEYGLRQPELGSVGVRDAQPLGPLQVEDERDAPPTALAAP